MDKNLLDNMSGQELKEMIDNAEITLEELDNTALEKIMNFEIDMLCFGTGDMNTVHRCSELLNERNNVKKLGEEEIISIIGKAQNEHVIIVDKESTESKAPVIKKRNVILRRIGLVAAVLTTLIITTTLVAAAFGVNIFEYIGKMARGDEGSQMVVDNFTFYHNGEAKQYSSIEEMIEKEKLDIMYPTKWPEGIYLSSVRMGNEINDNSTIQLFTNEPNIGVNIELSGNPLNSSSEEIIEHCGIKFYVKHDEMFSASCYYNENIYIITANNKNDLLLIIKSFKE